MTHHLEPTTPDVSGAAVASADLLDSATPGTGVPAHPRPTPPRGFTVFLLLAAIGMGAAEMSAALLTLTLKATQIDAAAATTMIAVTSGIAGVLTLITLPFIGNMSDRSRSRFGRRRPYLAGASTVFVVGAAFLVTATNLPMLVAAHMFITLGFVTANVAVTAILTDQLPADRRGPAAALISLGTPFGALLAMAMSVPFGDHLVPLVLAPTLVAVVFLMLLAFVIRDPQWAEKRPRPDLRSSVGVYWVNPLRHSSFTWVFTSRMLVFSGVAALNGFQAVYLLQRLHVPPQQLGQVILWTVVCNAGATFVMAPLVGKTSDRLGIRKPFILVAALILAVGLVFASFAPSLPMYLVACIVVGVGQGVYFSVELALATQVLPDPDNPAKDLGILKIADNLPVTIVAALAPAILTIGPSMDPNFAALFIAGAISSVLGGLAILLVRGAK